MANADPLPNRVDAIDSGGDDDWPARAAATITQYVGTVRDKTTGPALTASRTIVYALAMALIAFVLLILLLILAVRILVSVTAYVPFVDAGESWLAYFILGAVFLVPGMVLWRKKEAR